MSLKSIIEEKVDRLINIMLTDGVQPGDLANNIFTNCYKKISFMKSSNNIIGELTFDEIIEE